MLKNKRGNKISALNLPRGSMTIRCGISWPAFGSNVVIFVLIAAMALMKGTMSVNVASEQADILLDVLKTLECQYDDVSKTWKKSNDCSKWTGVTCDQTGNVIELVLSTETVTHPNGTILVRNTTVPSDESYLLIGTISMNISKLTSLQILVLHGNSLNGTVPSTIGNLINLRILDLGENILQGSIPASIGNLTQLIYLDLSRNQYFGGEDVFDQFLSASLSGTIPSELGNLNNLEYLDLHENNFTGTFPSLKNLTKLVYLNLQYNVFGGTYDFLGNFAELLVLIVGNNNFNAGEFPAIIGSYTKLTNLSMVDSGLTGPVPKEITNLLMLQNLDLSSNSLTSIPLEFGNLAELTTIYFGNNKLTSLDSLGPLKKLKRLEFQSNGLTGSFPDYSNFYELDHLDASINFYSGGFPAYFGNFTQLTFLNLDNNNLGGKIPETLSNLKNLTYLSCAQCGLEGPIPPEVAYLPILSLLDLHRNLLTGEIPVDIGKRNLTALVLSFNQLTGTIPASIRESQMLYDLRLNNNLLSGEIENSLAPNLEILWLYSNSFTGAIPKEIGYLTVISDILLQDNRLDSNIPSQLFNITYEEESVTIDLSRNNFGGIFPRGVHLLNATLKILRMSQCGLRGGLPEKIKFLEKLEVLDLSNNGFSGPLPPLTNLKNLKQLNLANNFFEVNVSSLPDSNLEKLDLSGMGLVLNKLPSFPSKYNESLLALNLEANSISGSLTNSYFKKFKKLQAVFLQNNEIEGDIFPITIINATTDMEYISLRSNKLSRASGQITSGLIVDLTDNPVCKNIVDPILKNFCEENVGTTSSFTSKLCENTTCLGGNQPNPNCTCSGFMSIRWLFNLSPLTYISKRALKAVEQAVYDVTQLSRDQLTVHVVEANLTSDLRFLVRLFSPNLQPPDTQVQKMLLNSSVDIPSVGFTDYLGIDEVVAYIPPPPPPPPPPSPGKAKKEFQVWAIVVIVVGVAGLFFFLTLVLTIYLICNREKESKLQIKVGEGFVKQIPLSEVRQATNNFSDDMLLGVGGYGFVYKGMASNGETWAVKRAKTISLKGLQDFEQEVSLISRMSHTNIVKLLGFCDRKNEQILVYEFMANGSLKAMLRPDEGSVRKPLSFEERVDIAIGSAEGLLYLHKFATPPLIHRDIKSDNILLDGNLVAKVADFGLVKDNPTGSAEEAMKTRVAGTPGYIDPEYYTNYEVTAKSDVYSFGVVLFELITAKSALIKEETTTDPDIPALTTLPSWVQPYLSDISPIVDPRMGRYNEAAMKDLVKVATVCIERAARYRPSMEEVARRLGHVKNTILGISETEASSSHEDSDSLPNQMDSFVKNKGDINHLAPLSKTYGGR